MKNINLTDIFSNREILQELIHFFKFDYYYKFKYTDIMRRFDMSKNLIESLKK